MSSDAKPFSKQAADEDFPVALRLMPADKRAAVHDFYRFVRAADDIADHPHLGVEEKLARLSVLDVSRLDPLARPHALTLIAAFSDDARNPLIATWDDLLASAAGSAAPVGRFMLDLFGEDAKPRPFADALCLALQVLNHMADCGHDWLMLNRVYLPRAWLAEARVPVVRLADHHVDAGLRRVLDRVLDGTAELLDAAAPLPFLLRSRELRFQAAVTIEWAHAHAAALRRRDPLAEQVGVSWPHRLIGLARAAWRHYRP